MRGLWRCLFWGGKERSPRQDPCQIGPADDSPCASCRPADNWIEGWPDRDEDWPQPSGGFKRFNLSFSKAQIVSEDLDTEATEGEKRQNPYRGVGCIRFIGRTISDGD